eukprot:4088820-Pyramimonas_sp.AAC.1
MKRDVEKNPDWSWAQSDKSFESFLKTVAEMENFVDQSKLLNKTITAGIADAKDFAKRLKAMHGDDHLSAIASITD